MTSPDRSAQTLVIGLLKKVRYAEINSHLTRWILARLYREGHVYRIPFGPLRGMRMRYDRAINYHAILGLWELRSFNILTGALMREGVLKPGSVVCDVGANIGTYAIWFATHIHPGGTVYAFEPSPNIARRLQENVALNHITNVEVVELACAATTGTIEFFVAPHHHRSSLLAEWASSGDTAPAQRIQVAATTLDAYFTGTHGRPAPDFIKMDIEGGGVLALRGCDRCVMTKRPFFLIESHTPDEDQAICDLVTRHEYEAYRLDSHTWVSVLSAPYPHPQGVWGTLLLCPREHRDRLARRLP